jgi:hypothetical protein
LHQEIELYGLTEEEKDHIRNIKAKEVPKPSSGWFGFSTASFTRMGAMLIGSDEKEQKRASSTSREDEEREETKEYENQNREQHVRSSFITPTKGDSASDQVRESSGGGSIEYSREYDKKDPLDIEEIEEVEEVVEEVDEEVDEEVNKETVEKLIVEGTDDVAQSKHNVHILFISSSYLKPNFVDDQDPVPESNDDGDDNENSPESVYLSSGNKEEENEDKIEEENEDKTKEENQDKIEEENKILETEITDATEDGATNIDKEAKSPSVEDNVSPSKLSSTDKTPIKKKVQEGKRRASKIIKTDYEN